MSYCRFSEGDVYMYPTEGGIECQACQLAGLEPSIFTTGVGEDYPLGPLDPCGYCNGEGCQTCMIHGSKIFKSPKQALNHLQKHLQRGDEVPQRAIDRLKYEITEEGDDADT